LRIVKYKPIISVKRRIVHPSWALTQESFEWKINMGHSVLLKMKGAYSKVADKKFNITTVTLDQARSIVEKYKSGMTLNDYGEIIESGANKNIKKWKDVIEFENDFTFEELNKITNAEIVLDRSKDLNEEEKMEIKMVMNTIDKFYQKAILAQREIWNTDKRVQEVMKKLNDFGFLSVERVNEILGFELIEMSEEHKRRYL